MAKIFLGLFIAMFFHGALAETFSDSDGVYVFDASKADWVPIPAQTLGTRLVYRADYPMLPLSFPGLVTSGQANFALGIGTRDYSALPVVDTGESLRIFIRGRNPVLAALTPLIDIEEEGVAGPESYGERNDIRFVDTMYGWIPSITPGFETKTIDNFSSEYIFEHPDSQWPEYRSSNFGLCQGCNYKLYGLSISMKCESIDGEDHQVRHVFVQKSIWNVLH